MACLTGHNTTQKPIHGPCLGLKSMHKACIGTMTRNGPTTCDTTWHDVGPCRPNTARWTYIHGDAAEQSDGHEPELLRQRGCGSIRGPSMVMLECRRSASLPKDMNPLENKAITVCVVAATQHLCPSCTTTSVALSEASQDT